MFGSGKHSIPPNYIKVYRKAIIRSNVQSDRLNKKISSFFIVIRNHFNEFFLFSYQYYKISCNLKDCLWTKFI